MTLSVWIRNYADPLTADFYRFYGGSPRDLLARGVPMLDIAAMAVHLPPGCATHRAIRPPEADDAWTLEAQLLAALIDVTSQLNARHEAVTAGKRKVSYPEPIPRPGVGPARNVEQIQTDSFESIEAFDAWYAEKFS